MTYVDGFVLKIKKENLEAYQKMATLGGGVWKKNGALQYIECVGEDMAPKMSEDLPEEMKSEGMKMKTFPELAQAKDDELVIFSFITFKSKEHRDEVNEKVMKDPEMDDNEWKDKPMPFEMGDMAYGGFKVIVEE